MDQVSKGKLGRMSLPGRLSQRRHRQRRREGGRMKPRRSEPSPALCLWEARPGMNGEEVGPRNTDSEACYTVSPSLSCSCSVLLTSVHLSSTCCVPSTVSSTLHISQASSQPPYEVAITTIPILQTIKTKSHRSQVTFPK